MKFLVIKYLQIILFLVYLNHVVTLSISKEKILKQLKPYMQSEKKHLHQKSQTKQKQKQSVQFKIPKRKYSIQEYINLINQKKSKKVFQKRFTQLNSALIQPPIIIDLQDFQSDIEQIQQKIQNTFSNLAQTLNQFIIMKDRHADMSQKDKFEEFENIIYGIGYNNNNLYKIYPQLERLRFHLINYYDNHILNLQIHRNSNRNAVIKVKKTFLNMIRKTKLMGILQELYFEILNKLRALTIKVMHNFMHQKYRDLDKENFENMLQQIVNISQKQVLTVKSYNKQGQLKKYYVPLVDLENVLQSINSSL